MTTAVSSSNPSTGSISLTGLLGGVAGSIDTTTLISELMAAASVPENQLNDQLTNEQNVISAYQQIATSVQAVQTAAQALTEPDTWKATTVASTDASVVATGSASASPGTTTFNVTALASAQVTTVAADASGDVMTNPTAGFVITGTDGTPHTLTPTSGSAADVASAINNAGLGIHANVVTTDSGSVLQMTSNKTGAAAAFTATGFDSLAQNLTTASNAQVTVGDPANGGYTVSSQTNTFTSAIPGVTFSVSALASNVTLTVGSDAQSIGDKVQTLVNAINSATNVISSATGQGDILQGDFALNSLSQDFSALVSHGTASGGSLSSYGIDITSDGTLTFDEDTFLSAYASDPTGTQSAVETSFASGANNVSNEGIDPTTGSVTTAISAGKTQVSSYQSQIADWQTRLTDEQSALTAKFNAMESALASLQSQQSYLTQMINSMNSSSSSSSSSS